jgi:hypothetical protein
MEFVSKYETAQEAWDALENPQWLMWWLQHRKIEESDKSKYVSLAIRFSRSTLENFESVYPDDKRSRLAIEAAERWVNSPTEENRSAALAAWSAASAARSAAWSAALAAAESAQCSWIREVFPCPPVMDDVE